MVMNRKTFDEWKLKMLMSKDRNLPFGGDVAHIRDLPKNLALKVQTSEYNIEHRESHPVGSMYGLFTYHKNQPFMDPMGMFSVQLTAIRDI